MKKAGLVILACLLASVAFGQKVDPMAFQTWRVVDLNYSVQSEGMFCIIDVENPDKKSAITCATIVLLIEHLNPDRQEGVLIAYLYVEHGIEHIFIIDPETETYVRVNKTSV